MRINYDQEAGVFWVPARDRQSFVLQLVAGRKYNLKLDRQEFPVELASVLHIYGECIPEFCEEGIQIVKQIGEQFNYWVSDKYTIDIDSSLLPHQIGDIARFKERGYGLNLSSCGTGKTRTMTHSITKWPVLIICPNIARDVWKQEFEHIGKTVEVIWANNEKERKKIRSGAEIVICGFPLTSKFSRLAKYGNRSLSKEERTPGLLNNYFKTVIIDEAHRIKNPDSIQTRAAWALLDEAEHKFLLTGSPISENPLEIWSLLRGIRPDLFSSSVAFRERYALIHIGFSGYEEVIGIKPERKKEYQQLIKGYSLRHQLEEVVPTMPNTVYSEIHCQMAPTQRKAYEAMASEYRVVIDNERIFAPSSIAQRTRLLQFAGGTPRIEDGHVVELCIPSCKVDALLQWLEDHNEPIVVFSDSRLLLDLAGNQLSLAGYETAIIAGGVSENARALAVRQFQAGEIDIILIQTSAGSEAITLTRASTTIFLGRPDSATLGLQAERRSRRLGQLAEHVQVIDIITDETIESQKHSMLLDKNNQSHDLLGDSFKEGR